MKKRPEYLTFGAKVKKVKSAVKKVKGARAGANQRSPGLLLVYRSTY